MVGYDPYATSPGGWSAPGGALYAPMNSVVSDPEKIPIHIVNGSLPYDAHFNGIDNGGRIYGGEAGDIDFVLIPVPEPGSLELLLTAVVAVVALTRRRREA